MPGLLPWTVRTWCGLLQRDLRTGGASRDRTGDPLLAKQVLSQLSYGPNVVGLGGLEPPTSPLSGVRSNHLSYRPKRLLPPTRARDGPWPL
jgi:hypothetical protein